MAAEVTQRDLRTKSAEITDAVAVLGVGRKPRARISDLMIASVAIANGLPLYTTNPDDFMGLDHLLRVVAVPTT